jgi:hypothetical protein
MISDLYRQCEKLLVLIRASKLLDEIYGGKCNKTAKYVLRRVLWFLPLNTLDELRSFSEYLTQCKDSMIALSYYIRNLTDPNLLFKYIKTLSKSVKTTYYKRKYSLIDHLLDISVRIDSVLDGHIDKMKHHTSLYTYLQTYQSIRAESISQDFSDKVKFSFLFKLYCIKLVIRFIRLDPSLYQGKSVNGLFARMKLFEMTDYLLSNFSMLYTEEKLTIKLYSKIFSILSYIKYSEEYLNTSIYRGTTFYAEFIIEYIPFYSESSKEILKKWLKFINRYNIRDFPRVIEIRYDLVKLTFGNDNKHFQNLRKSIGEQVYFEVCIDLFKSDHSYTYEILYNTRFLNYIRHLRNSGDNWWLLLERSDLLGLLVMKATRFIEIDIRFELGFLFVEKYFHLIGERRDIVLKWLSKFNETIIHNHYKSYYSNRVVGYFTRCPIPNQLPVYDYLQRYINGYLDIDMKDIQNLIPFLSESDNRRIISLIAMRIQRIKDYRSYDKKCVSLLSEMSTYVDKVYDYKFNIEDIMSEAHEISTICSKFSQFLIMLSQVFESTESKICLKQILQDQSLSLYDKTQSICKLFSIEECFPELTESDYQFILEQPSFDIFSPCDQLETRKIVINYIYSCGFRRVICYLDLFLSTNDSKYINEISVWGRKIEYLVNHDYIKIFLNFKLEEPIRMLVLNEFGNILMNDSSVKEEHLNILIGNFMMHKMENACNYDKNIVKVLHSDVIKEIIEKMNLRNIIKDDLNRRVFFCYLPDDEYSRSTIGGYIFLNSKLKKECSFYYACRYIYVTCEYLKIISRSSSGNYRLEWSVPNTNLVKGIVGDSNNVKVNIPEYVRYFMFIIFGSVIDELGYRRINFLKYIQNWFKAPQEFRLRLRSTIKWGDVFYLSAYNWEYSDKASDTTD